MKTTIILTLLVIVGCSSGNNQDIPIQPLKDYAINYFPCNTSKDIQCLEGELPILPEDIIHILKHRKIDEQFIIYNSLIASRLYSHHLVRARQSYGINQSHPVWEAFEKYSEISFNSEFETSAVIYSWLYKGHYNKDKLLNHEYNIMVNEHDNIEKGIYWQ